MKTNKNINIYTFTKIFENEIEKINKFKNPHTMAGFDEAIDFFMHDFLPLQYDFCKEFFNYYYKDDFELSLEFEYNGKKTIYYSITEVKMAAFAFTITYFEDFNAYYWF